MTSQDDDAPRPAPPAPRHAARPRRALAEPGRLAPEQLERHTRRLRGEPLPPETPEEAAARAGRRHDLAAALDRLPAESAPAAPRPRADLSDLLDRIGTPDLARFADPLLGTVGRILPSGPSPERAAAAARRRAEHEGRRRAERAAGRARAAEAARRRAEETARREAEAAERARAARTVEESRAEAVRAAEDAAREAERHRAERLRERREAARAAAADKARRVAEAAERARVEEEALLAVEADAQAREVAAAQAEPDALARERRERADQEERRRRAALLARRRRDEERRRRRREAERARREAEEQRERAARAERSAAEAARRRQAEEAAEAERRQMAVEAARARAEAERLAQEAARERRRRIAAARALPRTVAARHIAAGTAAEDRRRQAAARASEEAARVLAAHHDRETRALMAAARELDGPDVVPPAHLRPLLADPAEGLDDAALLERARAALPQWRRTGRLLTKADAVRAQTAHGAADGTGPATGAFPIVPGYVPPSGPPEPRAPATREDRRHQLELTGAWLLFVLASAWGLGLFRLVPGLRVVDQGSYTAAHGGRYAFTTSVLSLFPLHPAVWPVLWLALGVYVAHQWGPGQGAAARQRQTRRSVAGALALTALWFPLAVLVPWGLEFMVWLAALALMIRVMRGLTAVPARTRAAQTCTDGVLGGFLGLLLAAAPTTLASPVAATGVFWGWFPSALVAAALLWAVVLTGARLALQDRGRLGLALGMAWTLLCLALPRLLPSPLGAWQSAWVGLSAVAGGLGVLLLVVVRRTWVREIEEQAAAAPQGVPAGRVNGR
ncbi:hypothetical protein KW076_00295 [Micrococcus porci]|uniref:hypothetical protein n=1 Tax=Micrococcus porci TaxID=2856555 RepID=UPI001CCE9DBF|nr:hypothetical protein [Micrococcus porci]UBH24682.1 hypothetical protein KW076_00295 [Micrococcus porci]